MPLYEYECKSCHHRFEKIQSFSAPEETKCPKCGAEIERVLSAPAVQFKGAGWYVNDYARKGSAKSTHSDPSKASEGSSKEDGGGETKGGASGASGDGGRDSGTRSGDSAASGSGDSGSSGESSSGEKSDSSKSEPAKPASGTSSTGSSPGTKST